MQKLYNLVKVSALLLLLLMQSTLQAQNDCSNCPSNVKMISDKQVLLDKIEIKEGNSATLNTNVYVSYSSGDAQKFWANLAIATAGVAVSTQLGSTPIGAGDSKTASTISPLVPLGVSVATLPSIWKNRPRGVPQAGLWLQHRDTRGKLTDTWEQPLSSDAKNSGELLSVNIDKPLSAGTVEVYLQNGSKNHVYYWGYEAIKNIIEKKVLLPKTPPVTNLVGCPSGYLPNGNGMCCNPFTGDCVNEGSIDDGNPAYQGCPSGYLPNGQGMCCQPGTSNCVPEGSGGGNGGGGGNPPNNPTTPFVGCPSGYLPNGQGLCCKPGSNECVQEATPQNGRTWKKEVRISLVGSGPTSESTQSTQSSIIIEECDDWYDCLCTITPAGSWVDCNCTYAYSACSNKVVSAGEDGSGGGGGGGGTDGGGGGGGSGGVDPDPGKRKQCLVCLSNAQKAYDAKKVSSISKLIGKLVLGCNLEAIGGALAVEAVHVWLNATPPSAVVLGIGAVLVGLGVGIVT